MKEKSQEPKWEPVTLYTERLLVDGGWIYSYQGALVFVPYPPGYCPHGISGLCMYCLRDILHNTIADGYRGISKKGMAL